MGLLLVGNQGVGGWIHMEEGELMREIHDADYISRLACSRLVKALPADSDSAILNGNLKFIHSISKLKQYRYNA